MLGVLMHVGPVHREHIISSFRQSDKAIEQATAPPRQAIALSNADSAPLPAGYQFSSSSTISARYAGPPHELLGGERSDSQVRHDRSQ